MCGRVSYPVYVVYSIYGKTMHRESSAKNSNSNQRMRGLTHHLASCMATTGSTENRNWNTLWACPRNSEFELRMCIFRVLVVCKIPRILCTAGVFLATWQNAQRWLQGFPSALVSCCVTLLQAHLKKRTNLLLRHERQDIVLS